VAIGGNRKENTKTKLPLRSCQNTGTPKGNSTKKRLGNPKKFGKTFTVMKQYGTPRRRANKNRRGTQGRAKRAGEKIPKLHERDVFRRRREKDKEFTDRQPTSPRPKSGCEKGNLGGGRRRREGCEKCSISSGGTEGETWWVG